MRSKSMDEDYEEEGSEGGESIMDIKLREKE
jgi:hypothetical protein